MAASPVGAATRRKLGEGPARYRAAIAGLGRASLSARPEPGKWSIQEVLSHLADTEMAYGWRFRMMLAHDRPVLVPFDQDAFVEQLGSARQDPKAALARYAALRASLLELLGLVTAEQLDRSGMHGELGEIKAGWVVERLAQHDAAHLKQIARLRRALAKKRAN